MVCNQTGTYPFLGGHLLNRKIVLRHIAVPFLLVGSMMKCMVVVVVIFVVIVAVTPAMAAVGCSCLLMSLL